MFKAVLAVLTLFSWAQTRPGFSRGSEFTSTPIQGQVRVYCSSLSGTGTAVFTCRDVVLDPQAYDYFLGPQDATADKVELTAQHEDGSMRAKVVGYDGQRGISREAFNLWISTLFQKPLLEHGNNIIRYKIYRGNHLLEQYAEGSFNVTVKRGALRTCPAAQYTSNDLNDCNSQYSICQHYFEEYHNCR